MAERALEGKVALVTGASRGIGKAIAMELARAGARVALNYRSSEAEARALAREIAALGESGAGGQLTGLAAAASAVADAGAREGSRAVSGAESSARVGVPTGAESVMGVGDNVLLVRADVSISEEARALVGKVVEHWGRIDILVNNAGINRDRTLRKLSDEDWLAVISTNLSSVFYCTSAVVPVMTAQNYGRIINISSVIGQSGNIGQANYAAAKGGTIAFTKSAALELARYNITVNAIAPGFTATDMLETVPDNVKEQIKAKIPLGRFAQPEEIARTVLFLAVDGGYITGQQINVNGGLYM